MIRGTISFEDFRAAQHSHARVARRLMRDVAVASTVAGVILLVLEYYLAGAVLVGGALIGMQAGRKVGERMLARSFAQHAALRSPLEYWWDEVGIGARNAMGQSQRPWASYVRVREDERAFLLYQTDELFEMVPKAWFTSPEQLEQFRRFARPVA